MSVQTSVDPQGEMRYDSVGVDDRGDGWVAFAGVMLLLVGMLNAIEGIAAIGNSRFFAGDTHYIIGSLNAWGWTALIVGVIQLLVGGGVFARNQFARWAGVLILG